MEKLPYFWVRMLEYPRNEVVQIRPKDMLSLSDIPGPKPTMLVDYQRIQTDSHTPVPTLKIFQGETNSFLEVYKKVFFEIFVVCIMIGNN